MHEDGVLNRAKGRGMGTVVGSQYSAKDFQLEVLDRLAEVQDFAASLEQSWEKKLEAVKEQRLLKFDSRALIAMGALALSISGYVIQDARNSARQDSELAATESRVQRLEQNGATTTEARSRAEGQVGEFRGRAEGVKGLVEAQNRAGRR